MQAEDWEAPARSTHLAACVCEWCLLGREAGEREAACAEAARGRTEHLIDQYIVSERLYETAADVRHPPEQHSTTARKDRKAQALWTGLAAVEHTIEIGVPR